jgi:hypothetical protein
MATVVDTKSPPNAGKRVLMRGTLLSLHGEHAIWIKDISSGGAVVSSQDRLPANCDVVLKRGTIFVAGRIGPAGEGGASVSFYRELDDRELS